MPKYVLDKNEFLKGIAYSEEVGGFWRDIKGIDFYRTPGVFRGSYGISTVYSDASSPALDTLPTVLIKDFAGTQPVLYALCKSVAVQIKMKSSGSDTVSGITLSGANVADKQAAAMYKIANGNRALFYASNTGSVADIGMYDTTLTFSNANFNGTFMSTVPAGATNLGNIRHEVLYNFLKRDMLYFNDGINLNQVSQFDANTGANGTVTRNVLDLPTNYDIVDFGYLDNYLAILAVTPPLDHNAAVSGLIESPRTSKVFFWDTYSDSWNYETPEILGRVLKLVNDGNGLYGEAEGDGIALYQFGLTTADPIFNHPGTGNTIELKGNKFSYSTDYSNHGAIVADKGQFFLMGLDNGNLNVFSIGNKLGLPRVLNKPFFIRTAVGTVVPGDLAIATPTRFYASYQDGTTYRVVRISSLDTDFTGAYADTVELDSFFNTGGVQKNIRFIEVHFDPLGATDQISILYDKNLSGSFSNLSDVAANYQIVGGASANPGTNATRWVTDKNLAIGTFRQLRLRIQIDAGSPKIRKIIVGFNYAADNR